MLLEVVSALFDIETVGVVDGGVVLGNGRDNALVLLDEVACPVPDGAETLDVECLAGNALGLEKTLLDERLLVEKGADAIIHAKPGAFGASSNAALVDEFASGASFRVDFGFATHLLVGVEDPGHNLLVRSHVWAQAVNLGSNEAFLVEFHCVLASDAFQLCLGVLLRVNLDTTFGTAKWNLGDLKLERHERRERHTLLNVDFFSESCAALNWQTVMLVLGTVADNVLDLTVVSPDGNRKADHCVTSHDHLKIVLGHSSLGSSSVKEHLHLLQETRFSNFPLSGLT